MNSIKILLYTLRHYKISTILNIIGLAIAFTTSYLLLTQVVAEFSYNRGIKDSERIFIVETNLGSPQYSVGLSAPIAKLIVEDNPFIESYNYGHISPNTNDCTLEKYSQSPIQIKSKGYMSGVLNLAGFNIVSGDITSWRQGQSIGVSRSMAEKYRLEIDDRFCFGKNYNPSFSHPISLIFEDFSGNSDFSSFQVIYCDKNDRLNDGEWTSYDKPLYIKLRNKEDRDAFTESVYLKIKDIVKDKNLISKDLESDFLRLTSLEDTYFSDVSFYDLKTGNKTISIVYLIIAIISLCVAFINFLNFFMALVPQRIKSMNIKKIHGATNNELRILVLTESVLLMTISLICSIIMISLVEKSSLNNLFDFSTSILSNIILFIIYALTILITGVLIAIYPSLYITSFNPAFIANANFGATSSGRFLRNTLISLQYFISIFFIICTIFVFFQNSYMLKYDMGFDCERILSVNISPKIGENIITRNSFTDKLMQDPRIEGATYSDRDFVTDNFMTWGQEYKNEDLYFRCFPVAYNFLDVFDIVISEGRNFCMIDEKSENGTFIFNDLARNKWNLTIEDLIEGHNDNPASICGFSENFNFQSLTKEIMPFAFYVFGKDYWNSFDHSYIKIDPNSDIPEIVDFIKTKIVETDPSINKDEIEVRSFRKELAGLYEKEKRQSSIITFFSVISVLISLMGVFGLVLFETQYRRSEIAIRRVNGATIGSVLSIFNIRFIKIISLCFIVSAPLATYVFIKWQEQFAYKVDLYSWVYIISVVLVMLTTLIVIMASAWRTVNQDPAHILRKE